MKHQLKRTRRYHVDHMRIIPRRVLRAALQYFGEPFTESSLYTVAAATANANPDFAEHIARRRTA